MAVTGANLDQLAALGQEFNNDADAIDALIKRIDTMLPQAQWTGGNAQAFTNNWQNTWKTQLQAIADGQGGLRANGAYIKQQVQALRQATGTGG